MMEESRILAVDIGNTNIVLSVHDGKEWGDALRVKSKSHDAVEAFRANLSTLSYEKAVVSSVVPYLTQPIIDEVKEHSGIDDNNPYIHPETAHSVLPDDMAEYAYNMPDAPDRQPGIYERFIKRIFDAFVSFFGLVILSPVFLAVIIAIKIDDPGPVFFTQKRDYCISRLQ